MATIATAPETASLTPKIDVDELKGLFDLEGKTAFVPGGYGAIGEAICRLTSLGRELGLHLLLATQYPVAEALGGAVAKARRCSRAATTR